LQTAWRLSGVQQKEEKILGKTVSRFRGSVVAFLDVAQLSGKTDSCRFFLSLVFKNRAVVHNMIFTAVDHNFLGSRTKQLEARESMIYQYCFVPDQ